ncbi:MAG: glycosyltransferase, partial [Planctomycetota bacterium]
MRIALLSWESLQSVAVGGIAAHVTELAAGLERRGHEVHVFVRLGEGQPTYEVIDGV